VACLLVLAAAAVVVVVLFHVATPLGWLAVLLLALGLADRD